MVKVIICGPPHSGKSVFVANLVREFPADSYTVVRACPDGEGMWSNNPNQHEVQLVREKGDFTPEFVKEACQKIDNQANPIIIVDVGGRISPENEEIFKHCDSFIVLSNEMFKIDPWVEFGEKTSGLKCIAAIHSILSNENYEEVEEDIEYNNSKGYYEGRILDMSRGSTSTSNVIKKIAEEVLRINRGEVSKDKAQKTESHIPSYNGYVIDNIALAQELDVLTEKVNADGTKISTVLWPNQIVPKVYSKIKEKVKTNLPVRINGVRPNFMLASIAKSCKLRGIDDVATYDTTLDRFIPIIDIPKKQGIRSCDGLEYTVIENDENVFLEVKVKENEGGVKKFELLDYQNAVLPEIDEYKKLYISGRIPNWLMASIVCSYNSRNICTFQPGNGFICTYSNDERNMGILTSGINGIDLNKYYEDLQKMQDENKSKGIFSRFIPVNPNKYINPSIEAVVIKQEEGISTDNKNVDDDSDFGGR